MTWSKEHPGPGVYRCRGPEIEEDEIIVCVYDAAAGEGNVAANPGVLPAGLKLRVISPESYMTPVAAPTTFGHPIYKDAEWAPSHEGG